MTHGILVLGAESSGTKLLARILVMSGCLGSEQHIQPFDATRTIPEAYGRALVWRRSLPHAHQWPDLLALADVLSSKGYTPTILHIMRDEVPTAYSQLAHHHVRDFEEALTNTRRANQHILEFAGQTLLDYHYVTYAGLCEYPMSMLNWLHWLYGLGLDDEKFIELENMLNSQDLKRWTQATWGGV